MIIVITITNVRITSCHESLNHAVSTLQNHQLIFTVSHVILRIALLSNFSNRCKLANNNQLANAFAWLYSLRCFHDAQRRIRTRASCCYRSSRIETVLSKRKILWMAMYVLCDSKRVIDFF